MSSSKKHFPKRDRLGIYSLIVTLSIALTIAAIKASPDRLIPSDTNTSSQVQSPYIGIRMLTLTSAIALSLTQRKYKRSVNCIQNLR